MGGVGPGALLVLLQLPHEPLEPAPRKAPRHRPVKYMFFAWRVVVHTQAREPLEPARRRCKSTAVEKNNSSYACIRASNASHRILHTSSCKIPRIMKMHVFIVCTH